MVGGSGCGKSTLINNIVGENLLQVYHGFRCDNRDDLPSHVKKTLLINNNLYDCHITESPPYKNPYDMVLTNQRLRVNLIIYIMKFQRLTDNDLKTFQEYTRLFQNTHSISAFVITGCEMTDRTRVVEVLKSDIYTKDFAAIMGKGIYTVGFPDISSYPTVMEEWFKLEQQKDVTKLHELIEKSNDTVDVSYFGGCSIL